MISNQQLTNRPQNDQQLPVNTLCGHVVWYHIDKGKKGLVFHSHLNF